LFFASRESNTLRLTQFSNFAIRVLMYSALKGTIPSAVPEIAKAYGASHNHIKKVAAELCQLGYLHTVQGRAGGVRLMRRPEDIRIGEVIRHTERRLVLVECFDLTSNTCPLEPACQLKRALEESLRAFFDVLDRYTLADLIRSPDQLSPLLAIGQTTAGVTNSHGKQSPAIA